MAFRPAADWISANPDDDVDEPYYPPAKPRKRVPCPPPAVSPKVDPAAEFAQATVRSDDEAKPHRTLPPARTRTRSPEKQEPATDFPVSGERCSSAEVETPLPSAGQAEQQDVEDGEALLPKANYAVGYGKPPVGSRFKPGQSGNPKGRPKGAKGLNTIVRETLGEKLAVRTSSGPKKITKIEAVLQKTLEKALKGDARAQLELMKLWRAAVPDDAGPAEELTTEESLSSADLAILAAFEAQLAEQQGERS